LIFGGDILRRYWVPVVLTIIPFTLYLSAMDAIAITAGTWTINPGKSINFFIAGILPIEEFVFFLLTNTLVTFGMILFLAKESWDRFKTIANWAKNRRTKQTGETGP
jgi:lycopene cyclase domain-containing protein